MAQGGAAVSLIREAQASRRLDGETRVVEPKERPILFSAPMVRAILAGTKTQTRRLVNPLRRTTSPAAWFIPGVGSDLACPYEVGMRLWVRETWARTSDLTGEGPVVYRACGERGAMVHDGDGGRFWIHHGWTVGVTEHRHEGKWFGPPKRWVPGIHMPRWASRITLDVTGVRVERLQSMGDADARAEGLEHDDLMVGHGTACSARDRFAILWDDINGKRALFVMLNPSTADAYQDDPTIRKCRGFANQWGCWRFDVANLFAWRATDPADLRRSQKLGNDVIGPENGGHLAALATQAHRIVVAWGAHARPWEPYSITVARSLMANHRGPLFCLGRTSAGLPKHPLMLAYKTPLEPFEVQRG